MANRYYAQQKAIEESYKKKLKEVNPELKDCSGIYFLTREDENEIHYFYIGQAKKVLSRLANHMQGYQHIDFSLKKRGFYSQDNPYGWKVGFKEYPLDELDKWEQYWILQYTKKGYQCRYNKTAGGQGKGKEKINDFRPSKGYYDGVESGKIKFSKELEHLLELHLEVKPKNEIPTANQIKAMEKLEYMANYWKDKRSKDDK